MDYTQNNLGLKDSLHRVLPNVLPSRSLQWWRSDLHLGNIHFQSWPKYRLSWPRISWGSSVQSL